MRHTRLLGLTLGTFVITATVAPTAQQPPPPAQQGAAQGQAAAQGRGARPAPDPRTIGGGDCRNNPYNCVDTPNPIKGPDTVWLEEMTWMDVRDAMKAGKTTIIISTGGIEPNGPWLALGKHNFVLRSNCDAIARKLGNAICAPILPFVPEGDYERKTSHMATMGTISMKEDTFRAVLTDMARSFKAHGFENIIFIGDSGGNQAGQKAVAEALNTEWSGTPVVAHIPEYYAYNTVDALLKELGVVKEGMKADGLHDDPGITLNIYNTNPEMVRWAERVKAGKASIDGVSIADAKKNAEWAKKIIEMRATNTVAAIKKAIAAKGK